ncbi:MAG: pyridine nucleotide-disulfide oxidoreductase [Rhodobacteraceae bacterium]|jgi:3-phenylpropionate/trans-cinnamate dioxygenase ferredoxin reductase subunit|nr:pyridine nucleotide-disulfide oxidoreductase [Paracoccaceae bacterium]
MTKVVVIGAGQAGSAVVAKLRNSGFDGDVTLIGAESVPPYQRPPLSKKYMMGEMDLERLYLRPAEFYAEKNIDLKLSTRVTAIDAAAKTVTTDTETLAYDHLVLTTGSWPRRLPAKIGGDLAGVYCMRDLKDADAMAPEFKQGAKTLIIGGGYIGLEAAAVAASKGVQVTLVEMADRILQRVAAPQTSDYFRTAHTAHGVDIREGVGLDHLGGENGRVTHAVLTDGTRLDIDFAIVGVGIIPASELAEAAGVALDNGIAVNVLGQTSNPSIWSAGDCASLPYKGRRIRLESVQNAIDQAEVVAQNIMGAGIEYVPMPWFWSDQYDIKLQIAGLNTGYDAVYARAGETEDVASFWYYQGNTLLAVDAINDSRAYMVGKRLIEMGKSPEPSVVMDPETNLKALLKA